MIVDMRLRPTTTFYQHTGTFGGGKPSPIPSVAQRSTELCVREMEDAGITRGVIMGRKAGGARPKVPNDEIAKVCNQFPGKFLGFAGLDISGSDPGEALNELDRCILKLGFAGVNIEPGISSTPKYADDPTLLPIYSRCQELAIPLSLSLSIMIADDLTYCDPTPVQRVAKQFPNLAIILSHACWPWVDQAIGVALACRNVYLSLDFYVTARMPGHMSYVHAANSLLEDRVLYGTAYPGGLPFGETVKRWRELPFRPEVIDKVLGKNAARILKLKVA